MTSTGLVTSSATATSFTISIPSGSAALDNSELTIDWPSTASVDCYVTLRVRHTKTGAGNQVMRLTLQLAGCASSTWPIVADENGNVTMEGGWPGTPLGIAASPTHSTTWIRVRMNGPKISVYQSDTNQFGGPMYSQEGTLTNNTTTVAIDYIRIAGQQLNATADSASSMIVDNVTITNI